MTRRYLSLAALAAGLLTTYLPGSAAFAQSNPSPADGAVIEALHVSLACQLPSTGCYRLQISKSPSFESVGKDYAYRPFGTVAQFKLYTPDLAPSTKYYWRLGEQFSCDTTRVKLWGPTWSFSTLPLPSPVKGAEVQTLTPVLRRGRGEYARFFVMDASGKQSVADSGEGYRDCRSDVCSWVVPQGKLAPNASYLWGWVDAKKKEGSALPVEVGKTQFGQFKTAPSLTVEVVGQGQVKSTPSGMVCSAKCSSLFPTGPLVFVLLQFIPAAGWNLGSFSGDCKETAQEGAATAAKKGAVTAKEAAAAGALFDKSKPRTASVKMDGNRSCKVTFVRIGKSSGKP